MIDINFESRITEDLTKTNDGDGLNNFDNKFNIVDLNKTDKTNITFNDINKIK